MAASVDPLVVGRIIGDVVDMFVPTVTMAVKYGSMQVSNGSHVKPSIAVHPPIVTISGHPHQLYTLVYIYIYVCVYFFSSNLITLLIVYYYCMQYCTSPILRHLINLTLNFWNE